MNEVESQPVAAKADFPHEKLALGLTAVTPLLIWLHYYLLSSGSYGIGDVERIVFPAYAVMLLTAAFGFYLAYHSPYHKSIVTIAARLLGMLSLIIVGILGLMLYVLHSGFGPS